MKNYTFIKSTDSEEYPNPIYAISLEIEDLELHKTYDKFGQTIGHDNADDYSIHNQYSYAAADCLGELIEHFQITSKINDYNTPDDVDFLSIDYNSKIEIIIDIDEEDIENFDREKINDFIKKWEEENAEYNTVKGFDYWGGRYWKTVTVEDSTFDEPTHKIIEDDSLEAEIDSKEWIKDGFGKKIYESENYWIIHNYCEGSFASYELYSKEEYNLNDID